MPLDPKLLDEVAASTFPPEAAASLIAQFSALPEAEVVRVKADLRKVVEAAQFGAAVVDIAPTLLRLAAVLVAVL